MKNIFRKISIDIKYLLKNQIYFHPIVFTSQPVKIYIWWKNQHIYKIFGFFV